MSATYNTALSAIEITTTRKVTLRLVPFTMLVFFVCFIDRNNIGIASLQMNADIGLSASAYGFGASIFFLGYVLFEVPSNILLYRVGARLWIARIMITWGLVASAMIFVEGPKSFYTMRVLLGFAEAGLYPGVILYLSQWFPNRSRSRALSLFQIAAPLSSAIGAPLMSSLFVLDGVAGLRGWQWIFLVTGLPAVVLGFVTFWFLTDSPARAAWLSSEERSWLTAKLNTEREQLGSAQHNKLSSGFANPQVWVFAFVYLTAVTGQYGLIYWLPRLVQQASGAGRVATGFLTALPWIAAAIAVPLVGWSSDRLGERRLHMSIPMLVGAVGLVLASIFIENAALAIAALCLAAAGINSMVPPMWGLHTSLFSGMAAASSIALINSIANTGGFLGPNIFGVLVDLFGSPRASLIVLAVVLAVGAGSVAFIRHWQAASAVSVPREV